MLKLLSAIGDGMALNRAYRWRGDGRFGEALSQLVSQHSSRGRLFPSERSSPRAIAMSASLNYHLTEWDEVIRQCNVATGIFRSKSMTDRDTYLALYCDELAKACQDHSSESWDGSAVTGQAIVVASLAVPTRYHRYFPILGS